MSKTKNLLERAAAAILAVAMALVLLPANALAADATTYTLTLNNTVTGHTYQAYQIFSGDLNGSTLSNVQWGSGVTNTDALIAALKADDTLKATFGSVTDAASAAEALATASTSNDDAAAQAFATVVSQYLSSTATASAASVAGSTQITGLSAGYYLVKDKDNSLSADKKDAYTRFIMEIVKDASAIIKSSVPTVEKKVQDNTSANWQDSADWAIGSDVPYQITGTMPSNIADYKTYSYTFTDTMSKGLTYTAKTAKVMIGTTDVTSSFKETVTTNADGSTTVTWACTDLKAITGVTIDANTTVVVTCSAKLNDNAVIGAAGNPNTVNLTYSNNPNKGGEGNTGKTPDDKNIVFTYKATVNKVDQDNKSLAGAGFTLYKKGAQGTWNQVKQYTAGTASTFEFNGLDDGDYKLSETTTPAGYNTISDIEFTISATHDETADDPKLLTLSGNKADGSVFLTAELTADNAYTGNLSANVVNKKGSVLPSTGGAGTTVLYIGGAALAAAAFGICQLRKKDNEA